MIFAGVDAIDFWFQSRVKAVFVVCSRSAAFFAMAIVRVVLILSHARLIYFAWATCGEAMLATIALIVAYKIDGQSVRAWRVNWRRGVQLLAISWPQILSLFAVLIYLKVDLVMLQAMAGAKAVGLYSAAARLSEVWYYLPMAISSSVLPSLIAARKNNVELYRKRFQRLLDFMFVTSFSIALLVTVFATRLIVLLFGKDYAAAGPILAIHVWSGVFVFMAFASQLWVTAEGLYHRLFWANAVGAVVNILLNLLLIPRYNAMGSAIATLLSYMIACYLATPLVFRGKGLFMMQTRSLFMPFLSKFETKNESTEPLDRDTGVPPVP